MSSSAPIEPAVKAATKSQVVAHDDEEMYDLEDTEGKRSDNKEWKEPKWAQQRRKEKKKIAQRQTAQSIYDKQGTCEAQGKSIQDIGAGKS